MNESIEEQILLFRKHLRQIVTDKFQGSVKLFKEACDAVDSMISPSLSTLHKYLNLKGTTEPTLSKFLCMVQASKEPPSSFVSSEEHTHAVLYPSREAAELGERFRAAKKKIKIISSGLVYLTASRADETTHVQSIEMALRAEPQLRVKILALNPQHALVEERGNQMKPDAVRYRERQMPPQARDVRDRWTNALIDLREVHKNLPMDRNIKSRLEVRLYSELPTIFFVVDDWVVVSTALRGSTSRNTPAFGLHAKSPQAREIIRHFDSIWEDPWSEDAFQRPAAHDPYKDTDIE